MKIKDSQNKIFLTLEVLLWVEQISHGLNLMARQKSNSVLSGMFASRLRGRGLDFEEARPYVMGDDIRNIDWRVTAKTGKTHTKIFTEEKEKPAFIFVDQSPTMGFGSSNKTKAVVAGELAAIFAHKIKKLGDRVGGMVYSGKSYEIITPKRDARNMLHFFQKIVEANKNIYKSPEYNFQDSLAGIFGKLHHLITHDFLVFIISDFHRYNKKVVRFISQLAMHNDVVLIKVYDKLEEKLPAEKMTVSDTTHQVFIHGHKNKVREKLTSDFDDNYANFKSEVEKHGVTTFKINTSEPVEFQLANIFEKGAK